MIEEPNQSNMKTKLLLLLVLGIAASCSAPKQIFSFGYYDYQAGKRAAQKDQMITLQGADKIVTDLEPLPAVTETQKMPFVRETKSEAPAMTNMEKKTLIKEFKKEIKTTVKEVKQMNSVQSAQAMDHDLKLAAIFGAIGIVLGALFSVSNIMGFIGFVAIVVALVFLIKWLLRQ